MPLLQINLFGGVEVMRISGESVLIPSRKAAMLLGYVALSSPRGISRGKLATLLWDDTSQIARVPAFDRLCSHCAVCCRNTPT